VPGSNARAAKLKAYVPAATVNGEPVTPSI